MLGCGYHFSDSVNPTCVMGIKESWEAEFLKGYCLYPNLSCERRSKYSKADVGKPQLHMKGVYAHTVNDKSYLTTFGAIPYCLVICGLLCFFPIAIASILLPKDLNYLLEMRHMQQTGTYSRMEDRDLMIVNSMVQSLSHLNRGGGHLFHHRILVDLTYPFVIAFQTFILMLVIGKEYALYGYYVYLEKLVRNPLVSLPKFNLDTIRNDITGKLFPTGKMK